VATFIVVNSVLYISQNSSQGELYGDNLIAQKAMPQMSKKPLPCISAETPLRLWQVKSEELTY